MFLIIFVNGMTLSLAFFYHKKSTTGILHLLCTKDTSMFLCVCVCVCVRILQELHRCKLGQGAGGGKTDVMPGNTSELPNKDGEHPVDRH